MPSPTPKRLDAAQRGRALAFTWNGQPMTGYEGETIAAALLANGIFGLRRTAQGDTRGVFCGMGSCFECRVTVNGQTTVRACVTPIEEETRVTPHDETGTLPLPGVGATRG